MRIPTVSYTWKGSSGMMEPQSYGNIDKPYLAKRFVSTMYGTKFSQIINSVKTLIKYTLYRHWLWQRALGLVPWYGFQGGKALSENKFLYFETPVGKISSPYVRCKIWISLLKMVQRSWLYLDNINLLEEL